MHRVQEHEFQDQTTASEEDGKPRQGLDRRGFLAAATATAAVAAASEARDGLVHVLGPNVADRDRLRVVSRQNAPDHAG